MPKTIIITRHNGLVAWLEKRGITGPTYAHVLPDGASLAPGQCHESDLDNAHVYGILPARLAARAAVYSEVDMQIPPDRRGGEHTPDEMDSWGAKLSNYKVLSGHVVESEFVAE